MNKTPLVSVIIPTYNHAGFIREALESLRAQSFVHWEAIVVNNFSEDDTIEVVESFGDSRIRLENFRNNGIIAASRNYAISLASGKFLAFLDSDDVWYPKKLDRCFEELAKGNDLVCHGLRTFGDSEGRELFGGPNSAATFNSLLYRGNCLTPSATVVRKDVVLEVGCFSEDPQMVTSEDYHLWIKLAQSAVKMTFIQEILGEYRIHSNNQSGTAIRHLNSIFAVVEDFLPSSSERTIFALMKIRRRRAIAYYGAGRVLQSGKKHRKAWGLFFKAGACWPFYIRTYGAMLLNIYAIAAKKMQGRGPVA